MTKERRWMKSVLAEASKPQVSLPWQRGARRRPVSLTPVPTPVLKRAVGAR